MMYKRSFKDYFRNKKILYILLAIVLVSICTLTLVYAALNVTLSIVGNAEVFASSWDIHLDNVSVNTKSVSGSAPTISGGTTVNFSTKLEVPGDFYEFTIDVVNDGTIDAMIESIVKTPTLTTAQAKYLKYEIEYQNGESINTRQLVKKNDFVRLKVRIEFRKDITASDLPTTTDTLNLSFTVVYVQSDGTGNNVVDGGVTKAKVISGDYDTLGSEICIQDECFYVISSDDTSVTMLAKYNLDVGEICTSATSCSLITDPSGIQNSTSVGRLYNSSNKVIYPINGVVAFSDDGIFTFKNGTLQNAYDDKSLLYKHVEDYKLYLENLQIDVIAARIISVEDYNNVGCTATTCTTAPSWFYSTSYWTGISWFMQMPFIVGVSSANKTELGRYPFKYYGVRPVIVISKDNFI